MLSNRLSLFRSLFLGVSLLLALSPLSTNALKHSFYTRDDSRNIIGPVGLPFGFLAGGHYELNVYDFEISGLDDNKATATIDSGFLLQRFDNEASFQQYLDALKYNNSLCAFESFRDVNPQHDHDGESVDDALTGDDDDDKFMKNHQVVSAKDGVFLSMKSHKKWKPYNASIDYTFKKGEDGLYFLIYQVCPSNPAARVSFELDFHFLNYDAFGNPSFLTAGEMRLGLLFFFFAISYLTLLVIWYTNLQEIRQGKAGHFETAPGARIYRIHHLMTILLALKFLTLLFESIRYHAIRISGHAQIWSFFYYTFTIIRGTFMFTVILLIGTGWSVVKPFLSDREKKVIFGILFLQVINNIAIVVISTETEGENSYARWAAILHLVDILCCCMVLIPLVWQVNALEKSIGDDNVSNGNGNSHDEENSNGNGNYNGEETSRLNGPVVLEEGEKGQILSKLKQFRTFYLLVVAYIYATRIIVYLFATLLDYKHLWVQHFVVEVITLSFYVVVGLLFRPMLDNSYKSSKKRQERSNEEGIALTRTSKYDK